MCTAIITSSIMIDMQAHNSASLFYRFEIQTKTKYFFIFVKWKTYIGLTIHNFRFNIFRINGKWSVSYFFNGFPLRSNIQFTQESNLLLFANGNFPYPLSFFFPF